MPIIVSLVVTAGMALAAVGTPARLRRREARVATHPDDPFPVHLADLVRDAAASVRRRRSDRQSKRAEQRRGPIS